VAEAGERHAIVRLATDRLPAGPWIYARSVRPPEAEIQPGAVVELLDASERFVGHGLYNPASDVRVRVLSRGRRAALDRPAEFLRGRLAAADRVRRKLLRLPEVTDAYRVVHAEGDDLPGLVVDRLGPVLVCEHHALGFWRLRATVERELRALYPELAVVHRVPPRAARAEGFEPEETPGGPGEVELVEHGARFVVRPAGGHKTGFFCDQRPNRLRVAGLCAGRDVLDLCCNVGGFAVHAALAGARRVRAVDLDEKALELARRSARASRVELELFHADAFDFLRAERGARRRAGVVVLDPHKLVRDRSRLEQGLARYTDLNALALEAVAPGGLLATFSCSGAVDLATFAGTVFRAARRAERGLRVLEVLGAGPDHPQRPEFPRSRYLKGLLLAID